VGERHLERNYRSYPHILKVAREVLEGTLEAAGPALQSTKESEGDPLRVLEYGAPDDEAEGGWAGCMGMGQPGSGQRGMYSALQLC